MTEVIYYHIVNFVHFMMTELGLVLKYLLHNYMIWESIICKLNNSPRV